MKDDTGVRRIPTPGGCTQADHRPHDQTGDSLSTFHVPHA